MGARALTNALPHHHFNCPASFHGVVARLGALTPQGPVIDVGVTARPFPGDTHGFPVNLDGEPVVCGRPNATLPVAHILAGPHDDDRREEDDDARHDGSLGTLEGGQETDAAANERVSPAAGQDTHVRIGDGSSGNGA